jgi:hypothetical protein
MARHILTLAGRYRKDTYELRQLGFSLAGKTAKAALNLVSGGSAVAAAEALAVPVGKALGQWSSLSREKRIVAIRGHTAGILAYAEEKQRQYMTDAKAPDSGWDSIPGYQVRFQFLGRSLGGYYMLRYSGPGAGADQVDQGVVVFHGGMIARWWYLGLDGKKRLRLAG